VTIAVLKIEGEYIEPTGLRREKGRPETRLTRSSAESGNKVYDKISEFAESHLNKDGLLFFEINEVLSIPIIELLKKKGFKEIIIRKDINQKERMVKCVF